MSANMISGGRRLELYTVDASVTPSTVGSTPVLTITEQISTDFSKDDAGVFTITLDQIDASSNVFTFLNTYASPADGSAPEDITYEDNTQLLGAASVGTKFLALARGNSINGGTDHGKRLHYEGVVAISRTSGSFQMSGGTYARPSFILTSAPIDYTVTVASAKLTSYMTTPATQTLNNSNDKYGKVVLG